MVIIHQLTERCCSLLYPQFRWHLKNTHLANSLLGPTAFQPLGPERVATPPPVAMPSQAISLPMHCNVENSPGG